MIRNIILDLCGPIITIDIALIDHELTALGARSGQPYLDLFHAGITKRFERGDMTTEEFCRETRKELAFEASDEDICRAWNRLITHFDLRHAGFVHHLHERYRTFLLSNSDVVNATFFHDYLNESCGRKFLEEDFDRVYFSYETGLRKPEEAIFRKIMDENELKAEETLFVDDCEKHCLGAQRVGLQTHWLRKGEDLCALGQQIPDILI